MFNLGLLILTFPANKTLSLGDIVPKTNSSPPIYNKALASKVLPPIPVSVISIFEELLFQVSGHLISCTILTRGVPSNDVLCIAYTLI